MGEVERAVGLGRAQGEQASGLQQFIVGQAAVLPAKHQGHRGPAPLGGLHQPSQRLGGGQQGQGLPIAASTGGHHPAAVGQGPFEAGKAAGLLQHLGAMHGHQPGFGAQVIAAGIDQAQGPDLEIGAQPGHAAHVEGASGFHQHHDQAL